MKKNYQLSIANYQLYKDSGVEWLEVVPAHWKVTHLKRICRNITDGAHTSPDLSSRNYPFLTVVNLNNGILDFENCLFTSSSDYEKLIRNGCRPYKFDVLYSKDGTISETTVVLDDREFVVGSSFIIIRPYLKTVDSKFLSYSLSSHIMRYQANIYVKGASLPRISIFNASKLFSLLPPLNEQRAIAAYLDEKTTQIDRQIELLSQKIETYGRLKQSLINETVTRGLDPSVPLKDSGVEWIGQVPGHWEMKRLKDVSFMQFSNVDKKTHEDEIPVGLCNYVDVYKNDFIDSSFEFMQATANQSEIKRFTVEKHDVLVTKDSETAEDIANPALVIENLPGVLCGYHLAQIKTNENDLYGPFLFRLFQSKRYGFRFVVYAKGITRVGLSTSSFSDALTPIPPFDEQRAIAAYLDEKTAHINRIVEKIQAKIETLRELRKTLINDVVTGKIKVIDNG